MANDFYSRSSPSREFELIQNAFDKLPPLTGNANEVVVVNSGATGLTSMSEIAFNAAIYGALTGYIKGCIPSNNSGDATNDIDFSAGFVFDGTRGYTVGAKTKRADANWAAGTGNGGRASGASAWGAADWHLFVLLNPTTGATDFGFDTSLTGANLITDATSAGFTVTKRVGSLRTAGAAWPLLSAREIAIGLVKYLLKTPVFEFTKNWAGADDTAQTGTLAAVPGGIQVNAILGVAFLDTTASAESGLLVTSLDQTDTAAVATVATTVATVSISSNGGAPARASCVIEIKTSTSRTFRYRGVGTTADHEVGFNAHGWEDSRI